MQPREAVSCDKRLMIADATMHIETTMRIETMGMMNSNAGKLQGGRL
jgi:hypothetical protein